ncbi:MAG: hypothetical protein ACFFD4_24850 [Candidatus Odinarchaeota archaeon]
MTDKRNPGDRDSNEELDEIKKLYQSNYYELIGAKTLSRRGNWWTALLLVEEKQEKENKEKKKKLIFQRWKKITQKIELDGQEEKKHYWRREKDFTLSSRKQWDQIKTMIDSWIEDGEWE